MEGLPDRMPFSGGYRYVLFHFWFITITRRSLSVAIAASCLTFVALQVCIVTCHRQTHTIRILLVVLSLTGQWSLSVCNRSNLPLKASA